MKKVLSAIISLAIVICAAMPASFQALANSFETATPTQLNGSTPGAVCGTADKIVNYWYRFDCPATGYYTFSINSDAAPDGEVEIGVYDSSKSLVNFASNTTNATQFEFSTSMTAGSSYYYKLSIDGSVYSFNATVTPHNHTFGIVESIHAVADDDEDNRLCGYTSYKCIGCGYSYTSSVYAPPAKALITEKYSYTGAPIAPAVTVLDSNNAVVSPTEYTVSYEDNCLPGIAYATISFNSSKCIGELTASFVITPAKATAVSLNSNKSKQLTYEWEIDEAADGYEYQYSTSKKFYKSKSKTVEVKKNSKHKATIKNLIPKKKYYTRIRAYKVINGVKCYGAWSATLNVKVKK